MRSQFDQPPWLWPCAGYVHVPFCAHHCGYCDFAVVSGKDQAIPLYLEALGMELSLLGKPHPVTTLFLGGGTPTHLDAPQLDRLLSLIQTWLILNRDGEFSVEANPATLDEGKIRVLASHGVNRLSLGAQSFHDDILRFLERDHKADDIRRTLTQARKWIPALSLDLIFGVPGQTLSMWQTDLKRALSLEPEHVSTYGLTYEKGTPLWKQKQKKEVAPLDEETELAMYEHAMDHLEGSGFEHYEISNFARPGQRSRHNQVYWANHAYFGFGLGAARYVGGIRSLNTRSLDNYLKKVMAGESAATQAEQLPLRDRALETAALNLRRSQGIERDSFHSQTGFALDDLVGHAISINQERGILEDEGHVVRLTRRGKCLADAVVRELFRSE